MTKHLLIILININKIFPSLFKEAMDAFNDWFHHSKYAKPKEPVAPSGDNVTFKEKVAYEHELLQHEKDLERWRNVVSVLGSVRNKNNYNHTFFYIWDIYFLFL